MRLEDFILIFKGNLESVYLTFPFERESRRLVPFYDCKILNVKDYKVISIENIKDTIILSLIYSTRY